MYIRACWNPDFYFCCSINTTGLWLGSSRAESNKWFNKKRFRSGSGESGFGYHGPRAKMMLIIWIFLVGNWCAYHNDSPLTQLAIRWDIYLNNTLILDIEKDFNYKIKKKLVLKTCHQTQAWNYVNSLSKKQVPWFGESRMYEKLWTNLDLNICIFNKNTTFQCM